MTTRVYDWDTPENDKKQIAFLKGRIKRALENIEGDRKDIRRFQRKLRGTV